MINSSGLKQFTLYGLKNCDTVRKAKKFLDEQAVNYQFHDYRTNGLDLPLIELMVAKLGAKALLNTRGTTWRNLATEQREQVIDDASACQLMLEHPAVIKRPVLADKSGRMIVGFDSTTWRAWLTEEK